MEHHISARNRPIDLSHTGLLIGIPNEVREIRPLTPRRHQPFVDRNAYLEVTVDRTTVELDLEDRARRVVPNGIQVRRDHSHSVHQHLLIACQIASRLGSWSHGDPLSAPDTTSELQRTPGPPRPGVR